MNEASLDPTDWQRWKKIGEQVIHDMADHIDAIADRPVWHDIPERTQAWFNRPLPLHAQSLESIYSEIKEHVVPYTTGNCHPRFWAWAMGGGNAPGVLAETIAATLNNNSLGGNQAATFVENQVIDWIKSILGYPVESSGLLLSGASAANLVGLSVGLRAKAVSALAHTGLQGLSTKYCLYASKETHESVAKAVRILGIGTAHLRCIDVDQDFRIDLGALRRSIQQDIENDYRPFCIVANAGTVNTGAIDPIRDISAVAREYDLWLHVDAAIGAAIGMNNQLRRLLDGIADADSIALDLHKWAHIPYEAGCCLIRQREAHLGTFQIDADYLETSNTGFSSGDTWFCDRGVELSRSFKALKIWVTFKAFGVHKLGRLVEQNIEQARYLADRLGEIENVDVLSCTPLSIVCFRYFPKSTSLSIVDELNTRLVEAIQSNGAFMVSHTRIRNQYAIRVCILNHRTSQKDIDAFICYFQKLISDRVGS